MRYAVAGALISAATLVQAGEPLPFELGGAYRLIDQNGQTRTERDPDGHAQLLFFGYANCQNICSAALPVMAGVVDTLAKEGIAVTPVMITVAADQDRVETMGAPLAEIHPSFVGLTGSPAALAEAYDAFSVEIEPLFQDPEYGWVYAHGSFVHLLDAEGEVLTLLPPVLDVEQSAKIVKGYLSPDSG